MKQLFVLLVTTVLLESCASSLSYFQPNIPNGGRATSISARPLDEKNIVVASETGGLFRSVDKGINWSRISTSNYLYTDVLHVLNTDVVLATALSDSRTNSNGGIWRSTNKGETFARVPVTFSCANPPAAFCLFYESGDRVWAGTSCGLYLSSNQGLSWTQVNTPYNFKNIRSIQAFGPRVYLLVEGVGLVTSNNGGSAWISISSALDGIDNNGVHNAICMSATSSDQLYWATKRQINGELKTVLLYTRNAGSSWQTLKEENIWNRPPFVRLSRVSSTSDGEHFLYYSNGRDLYRNKANDPVRGNFSLGLWEKLSLDHADPSDICFEVLEPKPLLVVGDGGLSHTTDYGNSWHLTGSGLHGYNALQITEVTGSQHTDGKFDLYFATQDNMVWGSTNGGTTWPKSICCEGFWLYTTQPYTEGSKVNGVTCADCYNFQADPGLEHPVTFPNAPDEAGTPALLKTNFYVQNTRPEGMTSGNFFKLTKDNGHTWSPVFSFNEPILNTNTTVAGNPNDPVLFIPVSNGTTHGGEAFVLKRISHFMGDPQDVVIEHIDNFGELGIYATMFAFYKVFGVDPANPNHFIVTDIVDSKMKVTNDGGQTWVADNSLTNLVTSNGALRFKKRGQAASGKEQFVQCQKIAFNPLNPSNILVGTTQAGVMRSTNGGTNWNNIKFTSLVPNISSFFFHQSGTILSAYGSGLYKLQQNFNDRPIQQTPPVTVKNLPMVWYPELKFVRPLSDLKDKYDFEQDEIFIVRNGAITELPLKNHGVVSLGIDKGELVYVTRSGLFQKSSLKVTLKDSASYVSLKAYGISEKKIKQVRGIIMNKGVISGIILSDESLNEKAFVSWSKPPNTSLVMLRGKRLMGEYSFSPGDKATLRGRYFGEEASKEVKLFINEEYNEKLSKQIKVSAKGDFEINFPIALASGMYEIKVVQETKTKQYTGVVNIIIANSDNDNASE